tara:strand:- start:362 stop:853 length:492 start_codon:yes stop_codon:yes gene_type:complete
MNKKGAIEFSMTTIMVIIVGVVVLSLGIAWVMGSFEKIGGITDAAFEGAKEQLGAKLTAQDPMGVSPSTVTLAPGKSTTVAVGYLNAGSTSVSVSLGAISDTIGTDTIGTFTTDNTLKNIGAGDTFTWKVILKASATAGQKVVPVKLTKDTETIEEQLVVIVE